MIQAFMQFGGSDAPEICHAGIADTTHNGTRKGQDVEHTDFDTKPELKVGGRTCQCAGCGLYFEGEKPFDRHQLADDDGVYCRTIAEMLDIGMTANRYGVWAFGTSKKRKEAA